MKEFLKSANSAKIGKVFKTARIEHGLSKIEVSNRVFINVKYINAIELGDYSIFPSEVFARAYFLKYKKFLSINCDFPKLYDEEINQNPIIKKSLSSKNFSAVNFFIVLGVLALTLITIALIKNVSNQDNENNNLFEESKNISDKRLNNIDNSLFEENEMQVMNELNNKKMSKNTISNKLIFNFIDECWIEIYSYEQLIINRLFKFEETFEVEIERPFKIVVGNAGAIEASYNGINIDFIGNANRLNVSTIMFNDE
jgi:transcriptional regulator with XRE-family HTH domain